MSNLTFITASGSTYVITSGPTGTILHRISDHKVIGSAQAPTTEYRLRGWELIEGSVEGKHARFHVEGMPHLTTTALRGLFYEGEDILGCFMAKAPVAQAPQERIKDVIAEAFGAR